MENLEISERLYEDSLAGALARRKEFLHKEKFSGWEQTQMDAYVVGIPTRQERAVDKITALQLFSQRFPDRQGLRAAVATAVASLKLYYRCKPLFKSKSPPGSQAEEGELVEIIVHRLQSEDWVETGNGHFIPPCFPWAQILEAELQARQEQTREQGAQQEEVIATEIEAVAETVAKVLGRAG
jgi:hypothetical protein